MLTGATGAEARRLEAAWYDNSYGRFHPVGAFWATQFGEVVSGKVSKNTDFGSFVEITPGVEGLVHVSELSEGRVDKPDDVVKVGDDVQVRIIDIDLARGRLGLSVRAVENPDLVGRPQRSGGGGGGGRGGRKKEKRGKGTQTFGDDAGAGLKSQISAKSMRALDALKAQLVSESDD
ncbi:MAG: S1 RNA-binding domain-containing protein [Actinobacteria bacterium ATB1]|nr:S1 RNA-binding domain-containing protein [Actinobacteria bacterium ATB1]